MKMKQVNSVKKGYLKLSILISVVLFNFWFTNTFFGVIQVNGNSMNNALYNNAICITDNSFPMISRYDIVIAEMKTITSVKRVIGMPNDLIKITGGVVYINGEVCSEYNYFTHNKGFTEKEIRLKDNEYFLLGDNRKVSYDSREFGVFSQDEIKGKVINILWRGSE